VSEEDALSFFAKIEQGNFVNAGRIGDSEFVSDAIQDIQSEEALDRGFGRRLPFRSIDLLGSENEFFASLDEHRDFYSVNIQDYVSGGLDNQYRQQLDELFTKIDVERQLREAYGDDAKLVYSFDDSSYILLTSDDQQYDTLNAAEDELDAVRRRVANDVAERYLSAEEVSRIFEENGYQL
jgi:hypothetical protein